jgi:integrase
MAHADAPNTAKAYQYCWRKFAEWCRDWRHCDSVPASPEVVCDFLTWASQMRRPAYKAGTIHLALAAIKRFHKEAGLPAPIDDRVRAVLAGIMRQAARQGARPEVAGKKHLTLDQLRSICGCPGTEPVDVRDQALILVGFVSALRRSDLSRLEAGHVHFEGSRVRLWVPYSKTDQAGTGRDVYLDAASQPSLCPLRALASWKELRLEKLGEFRGPLFLRFNQYADWSPHRLSPDGICRVVKKHLTRVGEDASDYGAHSMRSGMITAADAAGANIRAIMDRTGHKSLETVMRYIKSARGSNPLAGVL